MTYQQKNTLASLGTTILILIFFVVRLLIIIRHHGFDASMIYNLWFWVIGLSVLVTIVSTVAMHVVSAVVQQVQNPEVEPEVDSTEDERDQLIKLKGTNLAYIIYALGSFGAMLSLVLGANPLVMFSLLILAGLLSTIASESAKLMLYGKGY